MRRKRRHAVSSPSADAATTARIAMMRSLMSPAVTYGAIAPVLRRAPDLPQVEVLPSAQVENALDRLAAGDVRYRFASPAPQISAS
jgi:hypothetical protein